MSMVTGNDDVDGNGDVNVDIDIEFIRYRYRFYSMAMSMANSNGDVVDVVVVLRRSVAFETLFSSPFPTMPASTQR